MSAKIYENMGFITLDELHNVFTKKLEELEEKVLPQLSAEDRYRRIQLVDFLDDVRLTLTTRARHNLADYVKHNPAVKKAERDQLATDAAERTKQTWEERVRKGRQAARDVGAL